MHLSSPGGAPATGPPVRTCVRELSELEGTLSLMRLLTATRQTQDELPGDFCFAVEGELVLANDFVCAGDRDDPDGGCGCGRAFVGLGSRKATTTALVRDLPVSRAELRVAVADFETARGLGPAVIGTEDFADLVEAKLAVLDDIARSVQVGAVVGLRLEHLVWRRDPASAGAG